MPFVCMRDGEAVYVRVVGRGEPVLMLPGLGMNSRQWLPFILPFSHRFRFYMPDFRGHGRSLRVRVRADDVFQSHADDVEDIIAHFRLQHFLLAGISLGATTAMHLRHTGRLSGLRGYLHIDQSPCVVNGPGWSHGLAGPAQAQLFSHLHALLTLLEQAPDCDYVDQLPSALRQQFAGTMVQALALLGAGGMSRLLLDKGVRYLPALLLRRLPLMHLADVRAYLRAYSGGGHDYRDSLRQSDTPVTLMIGMRSPLYAAAGQELVATSAGQSRIVRFQRSGHVPLMDEPLRFLREFRQFLYNPAVH